jgi:hypothetical protein
MASRYHKVSASVIGEQAIHQTHDRLSSLVSLLCQSRLSSDSACLELEERQKVLRKITKTKRLLDSGVDADGQKLSKKQRTGLEAELLERRVDLNYILVCTRCTRKEKNLISILISITPKQANIYHYSLPARLPTRMTIREWKQRKRLNSTLKVTLRPRKGKS